MPYRYRKLGSCYSKLGAEALALRCMLAGYRDVPLDVVAQALDFLLQFPDKICWRAGVNGVYFF